MPRSRFQKARKPRNIHTPVYHVRRGRSKEYRARVNPEGKTGFPYDLINALPHDIYSDNVQELKDDETLEMVNLIGALGAQEAIHSAIMTTRYSIFDSEQPVLFTDDPGELADDEDPSHLAEDLVPDNAHQNNVSGASNKDMDTSSLSEEPNEEDPEGEAPKLIQTERAEEVVVTDNGSMGFPLQQGQGRKAEATREKTAVESHCELYVLPPSLVRRAPCPPPKPPTVISYFLKSPEENYSSRVKEELGYEFPPILGGFIEEMVHEKWEEMKRKGFLHPSPEVEKDIHSLIVDSQVKLARLVEAYHDKCATSKRRHFLDEIKAAAREILDTHYSDMEEEELSSGSESGDQESGTESENEDTRRHKRTKRRRLGSSSQGNVSLRDGESDSTSESSNDVESENSDNNSDVTMTSSSEDEEIDTRGKQHLNLRARKGIIPRKLSLVQSDNEYSNSYGIEEGAMESQWPAKRRRLFSSPPRSTVISPARYHTRSVTARMKLAVQSSETQSTDHDKIESKTSLAENSVSQATVAHGTKKAMSVPPMFERGNKSPSVRMTSSVPWHQLDDTKTAVRRSPRKRTLTSSPFQATTSHVSSSPLTSNVSSSHALQTQR